MRWQTIIKFRHIMVHSYYKIEKELIWDIIQNDLQLLKEKIQILYNNEPEPEI
ncbi:MAG: DUF86 domain-containing protein [Bacteroidales bacterium]|nr:DUF86 domain-containing protein [Bacteroidales bacterium]